MKNLKAMNLQMYADPAPAPTPAPSPTPAPNPTPTPAPVEIDYDKLAQLISGKQAATEDSLLKGYFKQQGLSQEEIPFISPMLPMVCHAPSWSQKPVRASESLTAVIIMQQWRSQALRSLWSLRRWSWGASIFCLMQKSSGSYIPQVRWKHGATRLYQS